MNNINSETLAKALWNKLDRSIHLKHSLAKLTKTRPFFRTRAQRAAIRSLQAELRALDR